MKVMYHNDADGKCAAWLVANKSGGHHAVCIDYVPVDYTSEFPLDIIADDEVVWIVDYSIKPDVMNELLKVTDNVVWIDHHVSAIEEYSNSVVNPEGIDGLRSTSFSGCELTWLYLIRKCFGHGVEINGSELSECDEIVRLVGDRDTWSFKYGEYSKWLHEAFKAAGEPGPLSDWWDHCLCDIESALKNGKALLDHSNSMYKSIVDRCSYEVDFEGHKILVCNSPVFTSELFGDRVKDYPFVAVYCYMDGKWKVSLYSVNMDVVEFAKKHGGGGHPRACGFVSDTVPFEVK